MRELYLMLPGPVRVGIEATQGVARSTGLSRHRHQPRIATRIQNALQAIALANGLRRGPALWTQAAQQAIATSALWCEKTRRSIRHFNPLLKGEIEKLIVVDGDRRDDWWATPSG